MWDVLGHVSKNPSVVGGVNSQVYLLLIQCLKLVQLTEIFLSCCVFYGLTTVHFSRLTLLYLQSEYKDMADTNAARLSSEVTCLEEISTFSAELKVMMK